MGKPVKVSSSELKVLQILFDKKEPTSIPEMLAVLQQEGIQWSNPTVASYLKRLEQKGAVASVKKGKNRYFYTMIQQKEVENDETQKLLDIHFQGSLLNFLSAFTKNTKLSKQEIEEIQEWAEGLDDK